MTDAFKNPGDVNRKGQILVRKTSLTGSDHNAHVWVMRCSLCGIEYGSNSTDAWERKCPNPKCQGGKPGLAID
jgi:hypothetical protein